MALTYVLPLRWESDDELDDLALYLRRLVTWVPVIVVDASPEGLFQHHREAFGNTLLHIPPDTRFSYLNGKVNGVLTGVWHATTEGVVIADDDVRWDDQGLRAMSVALARFDLIRPQNYFQPHRWHTRWDTARSLINRAIGGDYPGTFAVRRALLQRTGGYSGDVLFENLELIRTVRAADGHERNAHNVFVCRRPPTAAHFCRQRIRQAYDDLAQPGRAAAFLLVVPALLWRPAAALMVVSAASLGAATVGLICGRAFQVFPISSVLFAPAWVLERGVCIWLALALRVGRGGVRYADHRLRTAAHSERWIRRSLSRRDHGA